MSKSFKRIFSALFVILILIAAASLSGCDMEEEIVKEGLELSESDNSAVLPAMEASAYEAILPIITAYYEDTGERLSAEELSRKAERVAKITLSDKIGPTDHRLFIEAVKERAEELAPVLCGEEIIDHRSLGEIYIELTKNVSAEYVGEILYELTIFSYDEKIEKHLLVGDSVNNVLAARLTSEKATIENEVGEKNFSSIVSVVFIFRALFAGGEESGELFERFSEAELLILLKEIDLEEIKIGTAGYKILADYYCKSNAFEETSYAEELLYWANDNGDLMKLLENAEDFWRLVSKIKNSMTKDDVISLKRAE